MPSIPTQDAFELLRRAKRPVIVLPHHAGIDGYASAYALSEVLRVWGKVPEVVAADGPMPDGLRFLKNRVRIRGGFGPLRTFFIRVDVDRAPLEELSYSVENKRLTISLTPRSGLWTEKDVSTGAGDFRFDLIMALGAPSLESFGQLFTSHGEFWYATPVVNVDHSVSNAHYGQVNVVDVTATSVAEIISGLLEKWEAALLSEDVATALLAGMMAKTKSFTSPQVTPRTLQAASMLLSHGARRNEIVDHLFRTRTVHTLRLWGRVLARLKSDAESGLVWSMLSADDFAHAGATEAVLPDVIDELIHHAPEAETVIILHENKEHQVCGLISAGKEMDSVELALPFRPVGTRQLATICVRDATLAEAEERIVRPLIARAKSMRSRG